MRKIFLIIIVVVVALLVALALLSRRPASAPAEISGGENATSATRGDVLENIAVPTPTSSVPANVAKPNIVSPLSPKGDDMLRAYNVTIKSDKFSPDTIIVKTGDFVKISFTAVDRDYDFRQPDYGLRQALPKGETRLVASTFLIPGTFTFFCERCGGPEHGPTGKIIVSQ